MSHEHYYKLNISFVDFMVCAIVHCLFVNNITFSYTNKLFISNVNNEKNNNFTEFGNNFSAELHRSPLQKQIETNFRFHNTLSAHRSCPSEGGLCRQSLSVAAP